LPMDLPVNTTVKLKHPGANDPPVNTG
jgi:hypothetical protein